MSLKWTRSSRHPSRSYLKTRGHRQATAAGGIPFIREAEAIAFAQSRIAPGAIVSADEGSHRDLLEPSFEMRRITHVDAYSRDGARTNNIESYFSRLRRMIGGQHHRVGAQRLAAYAAHAAWLEDHRDQSNGALADRLIARALAAPVSRGWKGYWQRRAA